MGQKKFKNAQKKVYISNFRVLCQLLYSQSETAQGGREIGGGQRGDVKAGLTLGVKGLTETDLKEITNKLYQDYIHMYQDAGFELITTEEAAKTQSFEEYKVVNGGSLNEDQFNGYITSTPDGFEYFIKEVTKKKKEKNSFNGYHLSADMDGALIVKVNIVVPFVEDAESGGSKLLSKAVGGVAKIVLQPNLRIESESVGATGGIWSMDVAQTRVEYFFAEKRIKPEAYTSMQLKKDMEIPGVFEDKKYKVSKAADVDNWGSQIGTMTFFNVTDQYLSKTQPVDCDNIKYKEGVLTSGLSFLNETFKLFDSYYNK